jgi:hypothetical protein
MDTHTQSHETGAPDTGRRDERTTAALLIGLGLFFLFAQLVDLGGLMLPILGVTFTAWGVLARSAGPLIPGGILNGIGLGWFLSEGPYALVRGEAQGGMFLLGFAAGWASIALLSRLFTATPQRWPLVPAGILALIGALVLAQEPGLAVLRLAGLAWPALLILGGLALLARRARS